MLVLLEEMINEDDELCDENRQAIATSREYFQQGGKCISFEEVVSDLGFSMEQVRGNR